MLGRLAGRVSGVRERCPKTVTVLEGLTNERNTWRLMGKLYTDRYWPARLSSRLVLTNFSVLCQTDY